RSRNHVYFKRWNRWLLRVVFLPADAKNRFVNRRRALLITFDYVSSAHPFHCNPAGNRAKSNEAQFNAGYVLTLHLHSNRSRPCAVFGWRSEPLSDEQILSFAYAVK